MSDHVDQEKLEKMAIELKQEFYPDFIELMNDISKDISNKITGMETKEAIALHTDVTTSFFGEYMSKSLSIFTKESAECIVEEFVTLLLKLTDQRRDELLKSYENHN